MHHARDRRLGVDPHRAARHPERNDDALARERGIRRPHERARFRQVDHAIGNQTEIALAHDLARDFYGVPRRTTWPLDRATHERPPRNANGIGVRPGKSKLWRSGSRASLALVVGAELNALELVDHR